MCANDMKQKHIVSSDLQKHALSDAVKRFKIEDEPEDSVKKALSWNPDQVDRMRKVLLFSEHMTLP